MSDRIAALEAERSTLIDHNWSLDEAVSDLRRERDELQATVDNDTRIIREGSIWQDRASAAETELAALRKEIRGFADSLWDAGRGGPVAYRRDIAARLEQILEA